MLKEKQYKFQSIVMEDSVSGWIYLKNFPLAIAILSLKLTASSPSPLIARSITGMSVGMKCRSINHLDG